MLTAGHDLGAHTPYVFVCVSARACACIRMCCACFCACACVCLCVRLYACIRMCCVCVCPLCVCMCLFVCACLCACLSAGAYVHVEGVFTANNSTDERLKWSAPVEMHFAGAAHRHRIHGLAGQGSRRAAHRVPRRPQGGTGNLGTLPLAHNNLQRTPTPDSQHVALHTGGIDS